MTFSDKGTAVAWRITAEDVLRENPRSITKEQIAELVAQHGEVEAFGMIAAAGVASLQSVKLVAETSPSGRRTHRRAEEPNPPTEQDLEAQKRLRDAETVTQDLAWSAANVKHARSEHGEPVAEAPTSKRRRPSRKRSSWGA